MAAMSGIQKEILAVDLHHARDCIAQTPKLQKYLYRYYIRYITYSDSMEP